MTPKTTAALRRSCAGPSRLAPRPRRVPEIRILRRARTLFRIALLMMIAPALHVHPATDTLLRYIHPEIEWVLLGIDERWRKELRVVFRKRPQKVALRTAV